MLVLALSSSVGYSVQCADESTRVQNEIRLIVGESCRGERAARAAGGAAQWGLMNSVLLSPRKETGNSDTDVTTTGRCLLI